MATRRTKRRVRRDYFGGSKDLRDSDPDQAAIYEDLESVKFGDSQLSLRRIFSGVRGLLSRLIFRKKAENPEK